MSSPDSIDKPDLPSAKNRHKIDVKAVLDSEKQNGSTNSEGTTLNKANGKKPGFNETSPTNAHEQLQNGVQESEGEQKESQPIDTSPRQEVEESQESTKHEAKDGERETIDSDRLYFTARAEAPASNVNANEGDGKNLEDDFEEVLADDAPEADDRLDDVRIGVTRSIPPRVLHELSASRSGLLEFPSPNEASLDGGSNPSSFKRQSVAALTVPEDQTTFTEESLQSAESESNAERPMSPPPVSPSTFSEASVPAPAEPEEYRGLVYYDGVDSLGRPVVIVNADVLPRSASRKAAVTYLLQRLEPIVTQGPYVAIFLNTGEKSKKNRMAAGWLASCYRQMSYPFKKNVKYVILLRPSFALNLMLAIMRPLISRKAQTKIKKVETLSALEGATNSEVTLQHLGPRFNTVAANSIIKGEGPTYGQGAAYQMPTL